MPSSTRHPSSAQPGDDVVLVGEAPHSFRTGILGNVTVTAWFGRLDLTAAQMLGRVTEDVIRRLGGQRGSSVHLVDAEIGFPDALTREQLAQISRSSAEQMGCVCVVLDGQGFWVSAFRGVLTSLHALAPKAFDIHASASTAEVVSWLPKEHLKRTGATIRPEALQRLLETGERWRHEARATGALLRTQS